MTVRVILDFFLIFYEFFGVEKCLFQSCREGGSHPGRIVSLSATLPLLFQA